MSNKDRESKIKWFQHRTGSSADEAKKFLELTHWKIDNAIVERDNHYKRLNTQNERTY